MGTTGADQATGIAASYNHVFTTGYTGGKLDGNTHAGAHDMFLVKHKLDGTKVWSKQLGSLGNDYATGVALHDVSGTPSLYVVGYTYNKMPLSPTNNAGTNTADLFLVKYDDNGGHLWTRQLGSTSNDFAQAVATDKAGNVYVAGYTTGTSFDTKTSQGGQDIFVVKYDSSGNKLWSVLVGTPKNDQARGIAADANGNVYVAGLTYGALPGLVSAGDADMVLLKFDTFGNKVWFRQFGTPDVDVAQGVATSRQTTGTLGVYVAGYSLGAFGGAKKGGYDIAVAKYDEHGIAGFKAQMGSVGNDLAYGITSDGAANVYLTGTTDYDWGTNSSAGSNDVFMLKLKGASGATLLAYQLGSTNPANALREGDIGFGVAVDRDSGIYVAGYTEGEFSETLNEGDRDVLIAKYGEGCTFLNPGQCGLGYGWGDPHLRTHDGIAYDFQGVGEFVLMEATSGEPFTVQVRQRRWYPGASVSVYSAVAAQVGTDRVGIYAGRAQPVWVNGAPVTVTDVVGLPGGGRISRERDGAYIVAWPGAERMKLYDYGSYMNINFLVPVSRQGTLRGLLGNYNGTSGDDFQLRDGTPLSWPMSFSRMYTDADSYANSWRITQAESLFDYATGESTNTFTDLTAPGAPASTAQLTPEQRQQAQTTCQNAGVTAAFILEACILDVAATGDATFATGAAQTQAGEVAQQQPVQPAPAPQTLYFNKFDGTVGPEWSSALTSTTPVGGKKFLGKYANDVVSLSLQNLPEHQSLTISFDVLVLNGWDGEGAAGRHSWGLNVDGVGILETSFSNTSSPQSYPAWEQTYYPAGSGASAINTLGYPFGDSTYKVTLTFAHMDPALRIDFFANGLPGATGEAWGLDNVEVQLH